MDIISFEKKVMKISYFDEVSDVICAMTVINGRPLADIVEQYEAEAARKGGKLPDGKIDKHYWRDEYYFGYGLYQLAGNLYNELTEGCWLGENVAVLMCCECGEEGCWPFAVAFENREKEVIWSGFNNWHRPNWKYSVFPVFRFDKAQYNEALAQLRGIAIEHWVDKQDLYAARTVFSIDNKPDLLKDTVCGCYYCLRTFAPCEIKEWRSDTLGTALCPYCGHDTVIGKSSGYPVSDSLTDYIATRDFLKKMRKRWFEQRSFYE